MSPKKANPITLPRSSEKPVVTFPDPVEDLKKRYDRQTDLIILVLVVGFGTMLFVVFQVAIDSFHFNSATYKEYSSKMDINNQLLETNKILLETVKQNQASIVEVQKAVEGLKK